MGNVNTFLTEDDYKQINEETGCECVCVLVASSILSDLLRPYIPSVNESQIRRLYSRFAHLDKRSKGYLE